MDRHTVYTNRVSPVIELLINSRVRFYIFSSPSSGGPLHLCFFPVSGWAAPSSVAHPPFLGNLIMGALTYLLLSPNSQTVNCT